MKRIDRVRAVIAENLLLKQQWIVLRRARHRALVTRLQLTDLTRSSFSSGQQV
jgi:hypothetical protein